MIAESLRARAAAVAGEGRTGAEGEDLVTGGVERAEKAGDEHSDAEPWGGVYPRSDDLLLAPGAAKGRNSGQRKCGHPR